MEMLNKIEVPVYYFNAVSKFLGYMKYPDLVGVTTFNSKPDMIYGEGLNA